MERKIGEIFKYLDEWYQCLEEKTCTCFGCDFSHHNCDDINLQKVKGSCQSEHRSDKKSVIFKKLEKIGEPFVYEKKTCQTYQLYTPTILRMQPDEVRAISVDRGNYTADIEIKQNKKDMEEKKLNLKPFDIQKAREGKPVCTREGRRARIICFDYAGETGDYPIVALVSYDKGNNCYERVLKYTPDGLFNKYGDYKHDDDLMMLPEKKEGWVNIYKDSVYDTKDEALMGRSDCRGYIDTINVSWEE